MNEDKLFILVIIRIIGAIIVSIFLMSTCGLILRAKIAADLEYQKNNTKRVDKSTNL